MCQDHECACYDGDAFERGKAEGYRRGLEDAAEIADRRGDLTRDGLIAAIRAKMEETK